MCFKTFILQTLQSFGRNIIPRICQPVSLHLTQFVLRISPQCIICSFNVHKHRLTLEFLYNMSYLTQWIFVRSLKNRKRLGLCRPTYKVCYIYTVSYTHLGNILYNNYVAPIGHFLISRSIVIQDTVLLLLLKAS